MVKSSKCGIVQSQGRNVSLSVKQSAAVNMQQIINETWCAVSECASDEVIVQQTKSCRPSVHLRDKMERLGNSILVLFQASHATPFDAKCPHTVFTLGIKILLLLTTN